VIVRLQAGPDRAEIDPLAGGRLVSLIAGGRERLIDRPQAGSALPAISWGSFLMAPWVGRVRDGRLGWQGRTIELTRNEGAQALHGVGFDVPWQLDRASQTSLEMHLAIDPRRWPFAGTVHQRLVLEPGALRLEASISASVASPAALGWHPWFRREPGEDLAVTVNADERLELDDQRIPSGRRVPVAGPFDLRGGPILGDRRLDDVYVDVRGPAIVRWPDLELEIEFGAPLVSVVVFSPPGSVCVEPSTAWPDALRLSAAGATATGQAVLPAGGTLAAMTTWRW
jgi:galactose mutarotase-like enzyme